MPIQSPAYKNHLRNLQNEIDAEKLHELQKLNLYNEKTFYRAFTKDILDAKKEIIIYSPFVTKFRSDFFRRTFETLRRRNICVFIFTRSLEEQDYLMRNEIKCALRDYEELEACIIYLPGFIHAKAAIIDREILWEGSLNILSQRESKEMMRRTADEETVMQVMSHLELKEKLAEGYKFQYERLCRNLIASSRYNHRLKVRMFITGVAIPIISRWLSAVLKAVRFLLRYLKSLASIISNLYK